MPRAQLSQVTWPVAWEYSRQILGEDADVPRGPPKAGSPGELVVLELQGVGRLGTSKKGDSGGQDSTPPTLLRLLLLPGS